MTEANRGRPRQANLRRAVSTCYYALFHCLARSCADTLIGGPQSRRSMPAWRQVHRALEHRAAADACGNSSVMREFPEDVRNFAEAFVDMQKKRHTADYSLAEKFSKSDVQEGVLDAVSVIKKYERVSIKHRRAFAAFVLFKSRRG